MFWQCDERRMTNALTRFSESFSLSDESRAELDGLTQWLSKNQAEREEDWSHEELINTLFSDQDTLMHCSRRSGMCSSRWSNLLKP